MDDPLHLLSHSQNPYFPFIFYIQTYAFIDTPYPLTFIGASYPLQRSDIIIMLANREGEHTNLDGVKDRRMNHMKAIPAQKKQTE